MKVVVTGADGFAGRWLCRHLLACHHRVFAWSRRTPQRPIEGLEYRIVDVRDRSGVSQAMAQTQPTWVFHLAALTELSACEANPKLAHETNVLGSANVFETMPETARGLLASTAHVYGPGAGSPAHEEDATHPVGVYAQSKLGAEDVAMACGRAVVIVRAFHQTGPGQDPRYVLASWAQQMRGGQTEISVGDLTLRRDFSDVRDIVAGYVLLMAKAEAGAVYNLASGQATSLSTLFSWVRGSRVCEAVLDPQRLRPNEQSVFCGNPTKAEALGWRRSHRLSDTLAELGLSGP